MAESFERSETFSAAPSALRDLWLHPDAHAAFTGAAAAGGVTPGSRFTAWDGYISGRWLEVGPLRLVCAWRTAEFPADAEDSRLELRFEADGTGTRLELAHGTIPDGQGERYRSGWDVHYFEPLRRYLARSVG